VRPLGSRSRRSGAVVGYLADGINDAPPLHLADVGISVDKGTYVARAAADIVLLQPSLSTIAQGVREGRRTSANTLKYIRMGISSNFGNMLSMAGAAVFLPFLPMLPSQILLNNLICDASQTDIPSDNVDPETLGEPARWDHGGIERFMLVFGPISSIFDHLTFAFLLVVLHAGESEFHTGDSWSRWPRRCSSSSRSGPGAGHSGAVDPAGCSSLLRLGRRPSRSCCRSHCWRRGSASAPCHCRSERHSPPSLWLTWRSSRS
jgi:magnesium-transporting ATPase (P-type)